MSLDKLLMEYGGSEVEPMTVYTDIFKLGEGYIQKENEPAGQFKANPLLYFKNNDKDQGQYRILFEDTFEEVLKEGQEADFCISNGLTYFGRKNVQSHASKMYAMIFDIDGITEAGLNNLLHGTQVQWIERPTLYPKPNYISLSGHNIHLYYVFEEPISLYPNIKLQLKNMKYNLTSLMWNRYTSNIEKPQYQGINQGFRPLGAKTKIKGKKVRVFKLNQHPYVLSQLNDYVSDENKIDEERRFNESKYTLEDARKKFPDWYERVIVKGEKSIKTWDIAGKVHGDDPYALYHWWYNLIYKEASYGHRYFCIMTLAIYAIKCDVPIDKLRADVRKLIPVFSDINTKEPFTIEDAESALECYDKRYCTFPIKDIEKLSSIKIPRNKRNGRTQEMHLKGARAIRDINNPNWREGNGRPKGSGTKQEQVQAWREKNPNGTKAQCNRDTKLDPKTIRKWWDIKVEKKQSEEERLAEIMKEADRIGYWQY